jgi:hypothetical protein
VGGTFHVVTSKEKCKKGETKLSLGVSESGAMGMVGAAGPAGVTGSVGAAGPAGPAGPAGAAGPTGPAGKDGNAQQGEKGLAGVAGATGPTGPTGPTGATGTTGSLASVVEAESTEVEVPYAAEGVETPATKVEAKCPAKDEAVWSGYTVEKTGVFISSNRRTAAKTGWEMTFSDHNEQNLNSKVLVIVYCTP